MSQRVTLLTVALFGLLVPNGLFVYWVVHDFSGWRDVLRNRLALAFVLDCFLAMGLLAYWFWQRPIGGVRWYWFVVLSLVGGLDFSLPMFWWLNRRGTMEDRVR